MKKIIVFGATGKIGAYFIDECVRRLAGTDYEVVAVGRKNTHFFTERGVAYYQVDIKKAADFDRLPQENVYAVVNFAGLLPAYSPLITPFDYIDANVTGGVRILEYARKVRANRVLYSQSWSEVTSYLKEGRVVLSPDMPRKLTYTGDHAFYSICKSMIVESMEYYHQEYGIKNFVFRLPNIYYYGPQKSYYVDGKERIIAYRYMIGRAIAGEDIELWGNPDAFRDIVYYK